MHSFFISTPYFVLIVIIETICLAQTVLSIDALPMLQGCVFAVPFFSFPWKRL